MESGNSGTSKTLGFICIDLETTGLISPGAPLPRVLCAATMRLTRVDDAPGRFSTESARTWPAALDQPPESRPPQPMTLEQLLELSDYLWECCADTGFRLLAWNGVGYDYRLLWLIFGEGGSNERFRTACARIKQLALESVDPMLTFTFARGFPISLQAAAVVMPIAMYKTGEGADCERLWLEGSDEDRLHVLKYCVNDVEMTATVYASAEAAGRVTWRTKRGKTSAWVPQYGTSAICLPVQQVMQTPFADNTFMRRDPNTGQIDNEKEIPSRAQFVSWLE